MEQASTKQAIPSWRIEDRMKEILEPLDDGSSCSSEYLRHLTEMTEMNRCFRSLEGQYAGIYRRLVHLEQRASKDGA